MQKFRGFPLRFQNLFLTLSLFLWWDKLWRWTCKNSTLLLRQHPYLVSLYLLTWQNPKVLHCLYFRAYWIIIKWARFYSISLHCHQNCFPILIMDSALLIIEKWVANSSGLLDPATSEKEPTILLSNQTNESPWYRGAISEMLKKSSTAFSKIPANIHLM